MQNEMKAIVRKGARRGGRIRRVWRVETEMLEIEESGN
jgi:hypothetical protein